MRQGLHLNIAIILVTCGNWSGFFLKRFPGARYDS